MSAPTMKGELMFPSLYLAAADLRGNDYTVTIAKVEKAALRTQKGTEDKWVVTFREAKKMLVLNKTNARIIAELHGSKADAWAGKRVTLYPTTCQAFGKMSDCVRVRETAAEQARAASGSKRDPVDVTDLPPPDLNDQGT